MPKKRSHGDGGLYYLKSRKLWRGVVDLEPDSVTNARRQKFVHSKSQTECRRKLDELMAQIDEFGAPVDAKVTIADWAPRWLEDYKKPHIDPHTYSVYASAINRWIIPTIGHVKVGATRPSDVSTLHKALRAAGRKPGTLRVVHQVVSMMLDQARKEGLCKKNAAVDVAPPSKTKGGKKRDAIPLATAAHILQVAATDDLASMWWMKMLCGPRQSETLGATLADLDLREGYYEVNWSLETVPSDHDCGEPADGRWPCGFKAPRLCTDRRWRVPVDREDFALVELDDGPWCLTPPKSAEGRIVPLIPQLRAMIGEYLARHADEPNPHGLIWRNPDGTAIKPKAEAQMWRDLLYKADIITEDQLGPGQSPITGHWARHTTVTLLASLGVDFQIIGEIVGHSSAEVTKIYRHADHREKSKAMSLLGGLMLPGGVPAMIES